MIEPIRACRAGDGVGAVPCELRRGGRVDGRVDRDILLPLSSRSGSVVDVLVSSISGLRASRCPRPRRALFLPSPSPSAVVDIEGERRALRGHYRLRVSSLGFSQPI